MRQLVAKRPLLFAAAGLALLLAVPAGRAQEAGKPQPAIFNTVDMVEIHGLFYPGAKKADAPCVLMLPDVGGAINQKGWDVLARKLQSRGYPVLLFDYRGHGKSTTVQPDVFWVNTVNQRYIKTFRASKPPDTINWKDFRPEYYINLVNDITAAKAYLDRLHDKGDVNASNVVVIGARTGALLGALWMKEELYRFRVIGGQFGGAQTDPQPTGKEVFAAVWLSMNPHVGRYRMALSGKSLLYPWRDRKVPMYFLYGDKDTQSQNIAKAVVDAFKSRSKKNKAEVGRKAVPGGGKLQGIQLVNNELRTANLIVEFLDQATASKQLNASETKDFSRYAYLWRVPGTRPLFAKQVGDKNLLFVPTALFLR